MIYEPHYYLPDINGFKGHVLDQFLASGYYRMQHLIFTTHHTSLGEDTDSVPVFWLRTVVKKAKESKASMAIRKKCAAFKVVFKKADITDELEELYAIYRDHVDFVASPSCRDYLHQNELENPYDSWMIEIRHENRLIAAGFFDKGQFTISGILNFYDPAYNKFSLGKYLVLLKIDHARANGIPHYYTGYISTSITKFDYKLFPDKTAVEVYIPKEKKWVPYALLGKEKLKTHAITPLGI